MLRRALDSLRARRGALLLGLLLASLLWRPGGYRRGRQTRWGRADDGQATTTPAAGAHAPSDDGAGLRGRLSRVRELRAAERPAAALQAARALERDPRAPEDLCSRASWEAARALEQLGRPAAAREAYADLVRRAREPRLALRALERACLLERARTGLEGARACLERGRDALEARFDVHREDHGQLVEALASLCRRRPTWCASDE